MSEIQVCSNGLTREFDRRPGYSIIVSHFAPPCIRPLYSCVVSLQNGGTSGELNPNPDRYPLSNPEVWEKIVGFTS